MILSAPSSTLRSVGPRDQDFDAPVLGRPSGVALDAIGTSAPLPSTCDAVRLSEMPCLSSAATALARSTERCQFDGKRTVLIGALSVWPTTLMKPGLLVEQARDARRDRLELHRAPSALPDANSARSHSRMMITLAVCVDGEPAISSASSRCDALAAARSVGGGGGGGGGGAMTRRSISISSVGMQRRGRCRRPHRQPPLSSSQQRHVERRTAGRRRPTATDPDRHAEARRAAARAPGPASAATDRARPSAARAAASRRGCAGSAAARAAPSGAVRWMPWKPSARQACCSSSSG